MTSFVTSLARHSFPGGALLGLRAITELNRAFSAWLPGRLGSWGDDPGLRLHRAFGAKHAQQGRRLTQTPYNPLLESGAATCSSERRSAGTPIHASTIAPKIINT